MPDNAGAAANGAGGGRKRRVPDSGFYEMEHAEDDGDEIAL